MIDAGFTQMKQKNAREVTLRAIREYPTQIYIDALFDHSRLVDAAAILERFTWRHSPYCRFA